MKLGFKDIDEEEQKAAKKRFEFDRKMKKSNWYLLLFLGVIWVIFAIVLGIQSIFDHSKFPQFIAMVGFIGVIVIIVWGYGRLLEWFMEWINKRMYVRELPKESRRTLKYTLNSMRYNVPCILWDVFWAVIIFTVLFMGMELLFNAPGEFFRKAGQYVLVWGPIILLVHVFLKLIHQEFDYTTKMLKLTSDFYNYGNELQRDTYKQHIEWSLKNNMIFNSKSIVLTKEYLIGSANSNTRFRPVAIPRDFVKAAEVRMVYSHQRTKSSTATICDAILTCKLNNDKLVEFYIARNWGVEMIIEGLQESGFAFTLREDVVEYR